jgi:hypothetical protein
MIWPDLFSEMRKLKEYQPVIKTAERDTCSEFWNGTNWLPCKIAHVLYEPMLICVSFPEKTDLFGENYSARTFNYADPAKLGATLDLSFIRTLTLHTETLYLFEVVSANLNLSFLKQIYLKRIYGKSLKGPNFMSTYDFPIYKKLAAMFSIPKQVWLISLPEKKNFPVDLCAIQGKMTIVGVRNTNQPMQDLIIGDNFYLSEGAAEDYKKIYAFGKFSEDNGEPESIIAENFPLPAIIVSYAKVTLREKVSFERQTLFVGEIAERKSVAEKNPLFHLHKIWLPQKKYLKNAK